MIDIGIYYYYYYCFLKTKFIEHSMIILFFKYFYFFFNIMFGIFLLFFSKFCKKRKENLLQIIDLFRKLQKRFINSKVMKKKGKINKN